MSPAQPERSSRFGVFEGRCHCGAIGFEFRTSRTPAQWEVRACQCSFCRSHGARTTSDADGSILFRIPDPSRLNRYRFGTKSADFYLCRDCGAYVASVMDSPRGRFATLNVNVITPAVDVPAATPVTYDAETPAQKLARREKKWTPVTDIA
jgi:hypothetical protein